jgi:hypothetical protein
LVVSVMNMGDDRPAIGHQALGNNRTHALARTGDDCRSFSFTHCGPVVIDGVSKQ